MARLALHPQVAGVVDVAPEYRMEEIEVTRAARAPAEPWPTSPDPPSSPRCAGPRRVCRNPGERSSPGDVLIAMGTASAMDRSRRSSRLRPAGRATSCGVRQPPIVACVTQRTA